MSEFCTSTFALFVLQCSFRYLYMMSACLRHSVIDYYISSRKDYDLRYFYEQKGVGCCVSGVAFLAMLQIYRDQMFNDFCGSEWYDAVQSFSSNKVIQGFLAEQICLTQIYLNGLRAVHQNLKQIGEMVMFTYKPTWNNLLNSAQTANKKKIFTCLYVPTTFNFRAVDGAILLLDLAGKTAHLFLLQITLSMRHKDSDEVFYTSMWHDWVGRLETAGYTIESTFVWIGNYEFSKTFVPRKIILLCNVEKTVHPCYHLVHINIRQVDEHLAGVTASSGTTVLDHI
jgi:hypothetical protein